jgi:hypothetical protein
VAAAQLFYYYYSWTCWFSRRITCESTIFSVAHRGTHRIDDENPMNRLIPSKLQARWGKLVQESIYVNYCRDGDDDAPGKNDGSRSLFNVDEGKFLPPPSTRWWGSRRVLYRAQNLMIPWGRRLPAEEDDDVHYVLPQWWKMMEKTRRSDLAYIRTYEPTY